jgi:hypothetical protein
MINTDYLVVGAGISGLYCIYKHLQNKNYILIEKNNDIGGRALTVDFHEIPIQMGAGIIRPTDTNLLNLIKELNLEVKFYPSKFHFTNLEFYNNDTPNCDQLKCIFKRMCEDVRKKYNEVKDEVNDISFTNFLSLYFDNNFVQKFIDCSLHTDYLDANVHTTINEYPLNEILYTEDNLIASIPNGGWRVFKNKLLEFINKDNIKLNTELIKVIKNNNSFDCFMKNGEHIKCKKLIFTADISIKNIEFINIKPEILNHIDSMQFIRTYSYHNKVNLQYSIKTTSILDKIIPITKGVVMSCYADNWKADYANELLNNNNKNNLKNLTKLLNNSIDKNLISEPVDMITHYWKHGIHYYTPNCNLDQTEINKLGMFILGEMTSQHQGWVEGCISSINNSKI